MNKQEARKTLTKLWLRKADDAFDSAVKSEFNRSYVKTGTLDVKRSKFYQRLFDDRQEEDYIPTATFEHSAITERIEQAASFIKTIRSLID